MNFAWTNKIKCHRHWLFAVLVAAFFVCARAGAIAHATSYGTSPHQHDNELCLLSVVVDEDQDDLALPPPEITLPIPTPHFGFEIGTAQKFTSCAAIQTRARSPPISQ